MGFAESSASKHHGRRELSRPVVLGFGVLAVVTAMAVTAGIALSGADEHPVAVAVARALMVGAPCAAGLYAAHRWPAERFGLLLVAAGALWFLTTLAESRDPATYTAGRTAGWFTEAVLVYLLLAFPSGRLPTPADRRLPGLMGLVTVVCFLPQLLIAQDFAVPSQFTSCVSDCPPNAAFGLSAEPGFVAGVLRPAGAAAVIGVALLVVVRLVQRTAASTPLARSTLLPVLVIAVAQTALLAVGLIGRSIDGSAWAVEAAAWLLALTVPALSSAFLLGLLRRDVFAGRALERFADCLRVTPDAPGLQRRFAAAFHDDTAEIVFPAVEGREDGWVDRRGDPVALPAADAARTASPIREDGRVVAAVVHDRTLDVDPHLMRAATAIAGSILGTRRLEAEAKATMAELRRSRARIVATAERERRRIERDLHDGAQQRLVALRIELQLAAGLCRSDPDRGAERLGELEQMVDLAIDDLRSLAHGVYPPMLADRGLPDALRVAVRTSTVPVAIEARDVGRYSPEIEAAVYFCIMEALQNVLKHARGARHAEVRIEADAADLRFVVRDDGGGIRETEAPAGQGLTNMRDRIFAVGGTLTLHSVPRRGTTLRGAVPVGGDQPR